MASAMVQGLLAKGSASPGTLTCTCGKDPTGPSLAERTGIHYVENLTDALPSSDLLILACKPQQLDSLPASLQEETEGKLILSILAGIPIARLEKIAPAARNIVRVMPNTPAQIGKGVSAYASKQPLTDEDLSSVETLLSSMGKVVPVDESDLDAITALSGSGPAYLFEFTRLLAEAGESLGLSKEVANLLARETIIGSAGLLEKRTDSEPIELVREVTSPGGTTEAALKQFEPDFASLVGKALTAARNRSEELSRI